MECKLKTLERSGPHPQKNKPYQTEVCDHVNYTRIMAPRPSAEGRGMHAHMSSSLSGNGERAPLKPNNSNVPK